MDNFGELKEELSALAEPDFRTFTKKLLPGVDHVLGVRLPALHKIARRIARGNYREYLAGASDDSFEEVMLQGFVIGKIQGTEEEIFTLARQFIPKISNWSVCDSFCSNLKIARECPDRMWGLIQEYLDSTQEFQVRFAVVMLLYYYVDEAHIHATLSCLEGVHHEGYYAKMAVAWAVSVCFIHFPETTMEYLKNCGLDDFTFNKALSKITDSLAVDAKMKATIRGMRRRTVKNEDE